MPPAGHLLDEPRQLTNLALANGAGVEGIVQHGEEQLNRAAIALDEGVDGLAHAVPALVSEEATFPRRDRPATDQAGSADPATLLPVALEEVVVVPDSAGDAFGL